MAPNNTYYILYLISYYGSVLSVLCALLQIKWYLYVIFIIIIYFSCTIWTSWCMYVPIERRSCVSWKNYFMWLCLGWHILNNAAWVKAGGMADEELVQPLIRYCVVMSELQEIHRPRSWYQTVFLTPKAVISNFPLCSYSSAHTH